MFLRILQIILFLFNLQLRSDFFKYIFYIGKSPIKPKPGAGLTYEVRQAKFNIIV